MVVADYYTGLGGIAVVEGLGSSDGEVGESSGAFAVEACQTFRTYCSRPCKKLDHSHIDLVGVPYLGDIHHTDWDSHMVVAHPSEDLALVPDQAVGEPAGNLLKLDSERLGVANSGKARVIGSDPGMESCFDYFVAGLGVV